MTRGVPAPGLGSERRVATNSEPKQPCWSELREAPRLPPPPFSFLMAFLSAESNGQMLKIRLLPAGWQPLGQAAPRREGAGRGTPAAARLLEAIRAPGSAELPVHAAVS